MFSANLRWYRQKNGLTIKAVASLLGVSETTVSNYETGKREPSLEKVIILSRHFHTSVDRLIGLTDCDFDISRLGDFLCDNICYGEFFNLVFRLDPEKKKHFGEYVELIRKASLIRKPRQNRNLHPVIRRSENI